MIRLNLLYTLFILALVDASGQVLDRYEQQLDRYSGEDLEIINRIRESTASELSKLNSSTAFYKPYLQQEEAYFIKSVEEGKFVKNDSLEGVISRTLDRIYKANNVEDAKPVILLSASGIVNAYTCLIRLIVVNYGIFSVVESEDELAFVLSHELSHMLKYHVAEDVVLNVELNPIGQLREELRLINKGRGTAEGLEKIQASEYEYKRKSRARELEADSMAVQFMSNSGFNAQQGVGILKRLGYRGCHTGKDIRIMFSSLFSERYKPQIDWFAKRPPIHHLKSSQFLVFRRDSILTHPHYQERLAALSELTGALDSSNIQLKSNAHWQDLIWYCYDRNQFELAMFYSLIYIDQKGFDNLISTILASLFLDMYYAKYDNHQENNIYHYVGFKTDGYTPELEVLNTVMLNMTKEECLMTGFMLLNNSEVFDLACQEHYFLLHQYATLLEKKAIADKIRDQYFSRFESGKYRIRDFK